MNEIQYNIKVQMKKAFFDKLREDFNNNPPKTEHIKILINELYEALCKFVPSKKNIHEKIKKDLIINEISLNKMPNIVISLIKWIELFQAPVYDKITNKWKNKFKSYNNCTNFLITFLEEYYNHLELTYKELIEARIRLINGDSVIPEKYRKKINNISDIKMKTGN